MISINETYSRTKMKPIISACLETVVYRKKVEMFSPCCCFFSKCYKIKSLHVFYNKCPLTGWKYVAVIFLSFSSKGPSLQCSLKGAWAIVSTVVGNAAFLKYSKIRPFHAENFCSNCTDTFVYRTHVFQIKTIALKLFLHAA